MSDSSILGKIRSLLFGPRKDPHVASLPERLETRFRSYIDPDESVLFILRTFRTIYKAPRWVDSNQFFRSWLVVTTKRLIVLKNTSSLSPFRDLPLTSIARTLYEAGDDEFRLIVDSSPDLYVMEFGKEAVSYCAELRSILDGLLKRARRDATEAAGEAVPSYCPRCGKKLEAAANYCHNCGHAVRD